MNLVVSRAAAADLDRLHLFLADKNPAAARNAVAVLTHAIESLGVFPDRGRLSGTAGTREMIVPYGQSAYVLRYAHLAEADEIVVLRIWHDREER